MTDTEMACPAAPSCGLTHTLSLWCTKYEVPAVSPSGRPLLPRERFELLMSALYAEKTAASLRHLNDIDMLFSLLSEEKHEAWFEYKRKQNAITQSASR